MTVTNKSIEQLSVDTIRTLSIDAVEKAKSGHPGMLWEPRRWDMSCSPS